MVQMGRESDWKNICFLFCIAFFLAKYMIPNASAGWQMSLKCLKLCLLLISVTVKYYKTLQ